MFSVLQNHAFGLIVLLSLIGILVIALRGSATFTFTAWFVHALIPIANDALAYLSGYPRLLDIPILLTWAVPTLVAAVLGTIIRLGRRISLKP